MCVKLKFGFNFLLNFVQTIEMKKRELIKKRDQKIVQLFYDLYDVKRKRMDDVLIELSEQHFFLDPTYIYSRIFYNKENYNYYLDLIDVKSGKLQKAR